MRAYRFWTPEEKATAQAMRANGSTYVEIGKALDRKPGAVAQAMERMAGAFTKLGRKCPCGTPISDTNKVGKCRRCNLTAQNYDAEFNARRVPAMRSAQAKSVGSPNRRNAARLAAQKRLANPDYREWLIRQMRDVVQPNSHTPEAIAKRDMKKVGDKLRERLIGWCPVEYRDQYRLLTRKGIKAAEARKMIAEQIKADRAALSPFERQMRALERGARLVANDRKPVFGFPTFHEEKPVDFGDNSQMLSKSRPDYGKEQSGNGQEEMEAA